MDVILQHISDCAIFVNRETVLDSNRWVGKRARLEGVVRVETIDCGVSQPLHLLISDSTVDHKHLFPYMHLRRMETEFEYSSSFPKKSG